MPRSPAPLPPAFAAQAFTVDEARSAGIPAARLRRRDVVRLGRGLYAAADLRLDLAARCRAALLEAPPEWVVTGVTAARLHGIPLPRRCQADARLHVLALGGANAPRSESIVGTRSSVAATLYRLEGVRLLAPAETWASLSGILRGDELVEAGDRLWDPFKPLATPEAVEAMLVGMGGHRGIRRLRAAHELMVPGSHSPRETRLRLTLLRAGLPTGTPNGRIVTSRGQTYYGDLVLDRYRVIYEYDGDWHDEDGQRGYDAQRFNALTADGWLLVQVTKHHDRATVVRMARDALISRGWRQGR